MGHGVVDVFAYQEALLIEAVFGIALLTMIWVGFRRWLQHKEKIADQTSEHAAQMKHVEARLKAIEQAVTDGASERTGQIQAPSEPVAGSGLERDQLQPGP